MEKYLFQPIMYRSRKSGEKKIIGQMESPPPLRENGPGANTQLGLTDPLPIEFGTV